ncbi:MAG TPA: inositol monophosphatase family protein [Saprospiraceae bacterium]|nr:inositol monophosphatase family protein [Saprospiraceae bacterium]
MQLDQICQQCLPIVNKVGAFIRQELGSVGDQAIEIKSRNSLVSYVDKTAESMLVEALGALLPEATFLTEEDTVQNQESRLRWIIDPLDGTTNFLYGIPVFAISVGLEKDGELVMGIVQEVVRQENFYAWKNGGAYCNGKPIRVSQRATLADGLLATGFPYYDFERTEDYLKVLGYFMKETRGLRRLGAAAVDLAFVACGRFDAFFEYALSPWDVAAGIVLVREAGGKVSGFSPKVDFTSGIEIIASNGHIHEAMQENCQTLARD